MGELIAVVNDLVTEVQQLRNHVSSTKVTAENKNAQLRSAVEFEGALKKATSQALSLTKGGYDEAGKEAVKARNGANAQAEKLARLIGQAREKRIQSFLLAAACVGGEFCRFC